MTKKDRFADVATTLRPKIEKTLGVDEQFVLTVIDGPDSGKKHTLDLSDPPLLVGKSPTCVMRLSDDQISRRHAAFDVQGGALRVRDLSSTNGTFVNDIRIHEVSLVGGESIRLGNSLLSVATERGRSAKASPPPESAFGRMIGVSDEMRRLYPICHRVAASRVPVLIEGEPGTGKELLAESIHTASARASGPFVVFDCPSIASEQHEMALLGALEEANGGTILVDEVAELVSAAQSHLLRAIERAEVRRAGQGEPTPVDVRVIVTTRRDLDREVQEGRFREDLFSCLATGRIELPPLRRRPSDVLALTKHFWSQLGAVGAPPSDLLKRFTDNPWPGNVRELYNTVSRYIALGEDQGTEPKSESPATPSGDTDRPASHDSIDAVLSMELPLPRARQKVVDDFERRYVARVLGQHGGSVSRAAAASGLALRYFQVLRAKQKRGQ